MLPRTYGYYYNQLDLPNAIALWGDFAAHDYKARSVGPPPINLELPSVISSFQPKSGGTYIFNRLIESFGYKEYWWGISHPQFATWAYAVPESLELFLRGGCATHSHCLPTPYNIRMFDR
jgi:hypothetical protein